ncbi:MAG: ATP-binding protein [Bifidobacterium bifidum]|nr:ATP-binding protein [Bifidobacterium bifidum]
MSIETLLNGESKNVEYKLTPPSRSINYTKTAVAFANGQGGCLVFGVEDQTLRVAGIAEDKVFTVMDSISDAIVNSCEPLIIPDITMHDVNGKTVARPGTGNIRSRSWHHASSRPAHHSGADH